MHRDYTTPVNTGLCHSDADEGSDFWLDASQKSLAEIWSNPEDDGYAKLLQK